MTNATDVAAGGYARFPRRWLALPVSPAAKLLLVQFCSAADADGLSWYRFEALAALLGRSKASVAAYVAELREAGVIETERQRTANGFHHRLRVRVLGWREIAAAFPGGRPSPAPDMRREGASRRQRTERRVQPTERGNPTGFPTTATDSNPPAAGTGGGAGPVVPSLDPDHEAAWRRCVGSAGTTGFERDPPEALLTAVLAQAEAASAAAGLLDPEATAARARAALAADAARAGLTTDAAALDAAASMLAARVRSAPGLARAVAALAADRAPHWRRLSSGPQIAAWLDARLRADPLAFEDLRAVWSARSRAARARLELARRARLTRLAA
jgi:hypothetical protein